MDKNNFIKASLAVFVFLGLIISLFPPFEIGNEKKYDFVLCNIKKNMTVGYTGFQKKFYNEDSLKYYKNLWNDKLFTFCLTSRDTFLTASRFLILGKKSAFDDIILKYGNKYSFETIGNRIVKYDNQQKDMNAINYSYVKDAYDKSPNSWSYKYVFTIDSIKKYDEYSITHPVYQLFYRKILFGELIVEYILAFFVSIIVGYFFNGIIVRKIFR